MRIAMLGHSGVGKTTYMACMYGVLQQSIQGFTLRANQQYDHDRLLRLGQSVVRGVYPAATDQRGEYPFQLRYQGRPVFEFTWADYRGGALTERSSSLEAQQLQNDLTQADGVLVFCDTEAIVRGKRITAQIGRLAYLVGQAMSRVQHPMPLGLVLTKADLVDEIGERVYEAVRPLVDSVAASQHVLGTVLPVACGPSPQLVQLPVLYVLAHGILGNAMALMQQVEHHEATAQSHVNQGNTFGGFLSDVWNSLTSQPTHQDHANAARARALTALQTLEPLVEPAKTLLDYLKELPKF